MRLPRVIETAAYQPVYTAEFQSRLSSKKYRNESKRITATVKKICRNPTHKSHLMKNTHGHDWRGKRDRKADSDIIIVFAWCKECQREGFQKAGFNVCCPIEDSMPADRVVFLTIGTHKQLFGRD